MTPPRPDPALALAAASAALLSRLARRRARVARAVAHAAARPPGDETAAALVAYERSRLAEELRLLRAHRRRALSALKSEETPP